MKRALLISILIAIIFFEGLLFVRDLPIGNDSQYYLALGCNKLEPIKQEPFLQIVGLLGCNIVATKLYVLLVSFLSAITLTLLAQIVLKNTMQSWLVALFAFGLTFYSNFWLQFENDQIGLLFGLIATLAFVLAKQTKIENKITCLVLKAAFVFFAVTFFFASVWFWKAMLLLLIFWMAFEKKLLLALPFLLWFLLPEIVPNNLVFENISFYGFYFVGIAIFFVWRLKETKRLLLPFLFYFGLTILKATFWVFAAFTMAFLVADSYLNTKQKHRWLYLFATAIFSYMLLFNTIPNAYPNNEDVNTMHTIASLSNNNFTTDYGNAWLATYLGYNPHNVGYITDFNIMQQKGFILTNRPAWQNCQTIQQSKTLNILKCE